MKNLSLIISVVVSAVLGSTLGHFLPASSTDGSSARIADELNIPPLDEPSPLLADEPILAEKASGGSDLRNELNTLAYIRALAQWNPERAFAVALQHQEKTGQSTLLKEVLIQWATTDSEKAISSLLTLSEDLQEALLPQLVDAILGKNPTGSIHLFSSGIIERSEANQLGQAFKFFASDHPENAARWILENEETSLGIDQLLHPFLNAPGGLETLISVLGPEFSSRVSVTPELFWSALNTKFSDPEAAKAFANSINDPLAKDVYNMAIARDLLNRDARAAVEHFLSNVSPSMAEEAAPMALELAERIIPVDQLTTALSGVLNVALSSGCSIPDAVMQKYIDGINTINPKDVSSFVYGGLIQPFVGTVFSGTDVMKWVGQLSDEHDEIKFVVLHYLGSKTLDLDPRLASEALAEFPPGGRGDHLVLELVKGLPDDPERALQWTSYMSDPEMRVKALETVTTILQAYDSVDALEWIDTTPLTPDEKSQLRTAITPDATIEPE